jgi:hypothetical protein
MPTANAVASIITAAANIRWLMSMIAERVNEPDQSGE